MILRSSASSRLRRAPLRVLPGGLHMPVERADRRVVEAHSAHVLLHTAASLLALALAMNLAAALAVYWQLERSVPLALPLIALGGAVVALGTGLVVRARQHLWQILPPSSRLAQRSDWTPPAHTQFSSAPERVS